MPVVYGAEIVREKEKERTENNGTRMKMEKLHNHTEKNYDVPDKE